MAAPCELENSGAQRQLPPNLLQPSQAPSRSLSLQFRPGSPHRRTDERNPQPTYSHDRDLRPDAALQNHAVETEQLEKRVDDEECRFDTG
jgi:hypothetical protein